MLYEDAANEVKTVNTAAGLPISDPAEREAMESLAKYKQSAGYIGKSALTGASAGIQAAQGAMNPLTAFIQGAAAGLQAPAQVFAQKQAQVMSMLDAMPFANANPEVYADFIKSNPNVKWIGGIPNKLAMEFLKTAGEKTIGVYEEHKAKKEQIELEHKNKMEQIRAQQAMEVPKPTIGSVSADRAFAREYSDYLAGGGYSDTQNQIKSLEDAREKLKSGDQYTGYFMRAFSGNLNPKALALQQQIESSIQRTLKQTLGGQFTEREGQLFMQRGFDPKLSEAENAKKLTRMIDQLKIMDIAKREAIDYFEQNGTLSGYKGRYFTIKNGQIVSNDLQQPTETGNGLSPEEEKRLQELEKKLAAKKK